MQAMPPIKNASMGFTGYLWLVITPDGQSHYVHAVNNYAAAEACGHKFSECLLVSQLEVSLA